MIFHPVCRLTLVVLVALVVTGLAVLEVLSFQEGLNHLQRESPLSHSHFHQIPSQSWDRLENSHR